MELLLKQTILPLALLLYGLFFFIRHKNLNLYIVIALTFFPAFSSNFTIDAYRIIYQGTLLTSSLLLVINLFRRNVLINTKLIIYILFFLIFILIGFFLSNINFETYKPTVINYVAIATITFYILSNHNFYENLYSYLNLISGLALIESFLVCVAFTDIGVEGSFSNSNYLAYFLGIGFTFILYINGRKIIKIPTLVFILIAIVLTGSRSIFLACLLVFIMSALISEAKIKKVLIYSVLLIITISGYLSSDINRFESIEEDESAGERVAIYYVAQNIFKAHPLFGIGYGQFPTKFRSYFYGDKTKLLRVLKDNKEIVTHNDFIRVAVELGLIAFVFFCSIMFFQLKLLLKKVRAEPYGLIFLLFIYNLVFSLTHNNMNSFMFWLLFYLPVGYHYYAEKYLKEEE